MTSVVWTQDAGGNYEISSTNHLLQLMHSGSLFTDGGTPPPSYFSESYVQTTDIDLVNDSANILPIGDSVNDFQGSYDGQGFRISNWSHTGGGAYIGLFGFVTSAVLKNMVLDGVWIVTNSTNTGGALCGTARFAQIFNVSADFAAGTMINGPIIGCMVGFASGAGMANISVGGIVSECRGTNAAAGVVGFCNGTAQFPWSHLRNSAVFTTGIEATSNDKSVGGVVANYDILSTPQASYFMNAMTGDIIGTGPQTGGLFGWLRDPVSDCVNSMRGNIYTNVTNEGAGIAGEVNAAVSLSRVLNYMSGDVYYGFASALPANCVVEKCVVAMRGTVNRILSSNAGPNTPEILLDTSYDIVTSFTNFTVSTMDLSVFDGVNENGLPFLDFSSYTDPGGNLVDWEFVYGNALALALEARPLNIQAAFAAVLGAVAYMVTVQEDGGVGGVGIERTVGIGLTQLSVSIRDVLPETTYVVRLYVTTNNATYTLSTSESVTTLENLAANYMITDFDNGQGVLDLSGIEAILFDSVANEVFTTGDQLVVDIPSTGNQQATTFVNLGDSLSIENVDSLIIPFTGDAGASQSASMILSDSTSLTLNYDNTNNTVIVDGSVYSSGDSIIVDGKKVTFTDI